MRTKRALEIFNSPDTFLVTLNGDAVWINSVNSADETANVKDLSTNRSLADVPVSQLSEPAQ